MAKRKAARKTSDASKTAKRDGIKSIDASFDEAMAAAEEVFSRYRNALRELARQ